MSEINSKKFKILKVDHCSSTMDLAKSNICSENLLVIAGQQSAGRGRQGRVWQAAGRGLYMTLACKVNKDAVMSAFSLVAALVIAECLGIKYRLKWPNDILDLEQRKIAGILLEKHEDQILIGLGLNIDAAPVGAAALSDHGVENVDIETMAIKIASELVKALQVFEAEGFLAYKDRWLKQTFPINTKVKVRIADDLEEAEFLGISDSGVLKLKLGNVIKDVVSAEVVDVACN